MSIMTADQADRIHANTARIVASIRRQADEAERAGDTAGAAILRNQANARERIGMRAHAGARIGQA